MYVINTQSPKTLVVFINLVTNLVEGILGFRIILKLFNASTNAPFVKWIYETSQPLLAPFSGMFPSPQLSGGFVIEFTALFAMIFYIFIAFLITEITSSFIEHTNRTSSNDEE